MLLRFLSDRAGTIAIVYINTAMVAGLAGLVTHRTDLRYAFLLSTTVLVIYLAVEFARWLPFARQAERLKEAGLTALANLPPGGTADQAQCRELLAHMYSQAMAERLRYGEAYQRQLHFINMWVHQMKTPVAAINLIAQRAGDRPPEELPGALESIEEETVKLTDGLELVLSMARLENFAVDFRIERVDLLEAVRGVINARRKQFIRAAIYPEIEAAEGDWSVLTDAKWNAFAIDQVVSNALKYGAQGGAPGQKLHFRLRRAPDRVTLEIADQGPGIPSEDLPRVFEPFFTGANGRRYADATGIGLYLVDQVARELGHQVSVDSTVGAGTVVTFTYLTKA